MTDLVGTTVWVYPYDANGLEVRPGVTGRVRAVTGETVLFESDGALLVASPLHAAVRTMPLPEETTP